MKHSESPPKLASAPGSHQQGEPPLTVQRSRPIDDLAKITIGSVVYVTFALVFVGTVQVLQLHNLALASSVIFAANYAVVVYFAWHKLYNPYAFQKHLVWASSAFSFAIISAGSITVSVDSKSSFDSNESVVTYLNLNFSFGMPDRVFAIFATVVFVAGLTFATIAYLAALNCELKKQQ
jgi:hypothetical protein